MARKDDNDTRPKLSTDSKQLRKYCCQRRNNQKVPKTELKTGNRVRDGIECQCNEEERDTVGKISATRRGNVLRAGSKGYEVDE
ncbi:hypothetical protein MJO28_006705 [Puccinia striiformis f. sp. tritici]|uniref:Uncharacterized protein n=1 Tax=Puccinia striiformis f. sp. tritici TaxID=168172 RepID=A0ACC0EI78_9BASI|nr:hypothetical protein MJO28_006705 [Puccinia striiformis f. sp. tritici]KAI7958463.1 hypothetical protein MJO29_006680 [Puccinia striiformis f. sp. tritici]